MTTFRSEEVFVGIVGLVLLPLIARRILRGLREGRLPLYRSEVTSDVGAAKFRVLLGLHVLSFLLVAAISADLLLDLGFRG